LDIEAYISSGILELYAAGALTTSEREEVEQMAKLYPEVKTELDLILDTFNQYVSLHAVTPPAYLKEKVLNAVNSHNQKNKNLDSPETLASQGARIIPMVKERSDAAASTAFKWLIAASITLLLVSNALSIYFYKNWKNTEQRLQLAEVSQQQYAQNIQQVRQQLTQKEQTLALVSDPVTEQVVLKGVAKSPDSKVTIYWHQETKKVYLCVNNLPLPPSDKQYQLWALQDGKPIDAGVLNTADGLIAVQPMKNIAQAQAFAITLEPKGGNVSPTLDQMYVMGTI